MVSTGPSSNPSPTPSTPNCSTSPTAEGTWVAVGFGGVKILSSTDARTWSTRASPGTAIPSRVAYGAGRFVAAGSGNTALTSNDGITWTNPTVDASTSTTLEGVAFGSGKFVLVGRNSNFAPAAFTSTDGTTWTPSNAITASGGIGFIRVGASSTGFVAAGGSLVYSSADGVAWTARTSALPPTPGQSGGVTENAAGATFAGTQFFVLGYYGSITTSPDGIAWTRRSSGTIADLGSVLHDGTRFVASGAGGTILTSPDGSAWTQLTTGSTADFSNLAYSGTRYVAAGSGGVYQSANLTAWTVVAGTNVDRWTAAAYGGGRFVVANSATTLGTRSSADGVTWNAACLHRRRRRQHQRPRLRQRPLRPHDVRLWHHPVENLYQRRRHRLDPARRRSPPDRHLN